jgi:hypothetical protein
MSNITIDLKSRSDSLNGMAIECNFKGFVLSNDASEYIISVHHGNPINEISKPILINAIWNELLIMKHLPDLNIEIIKKIKISLPKLGEVGNICFNNFKRIELVISNYKFLNLNNLPTNPRCIYITGQIKNKIKNLQSLSGSPVFNNDNKLIGIFCKQMNDEVYILPTYYIIKTLTKNNNDAIYSIDYEEPIRKVNNMNIYSEDNLYHKSLNSYIPLDVYLMLEGDSGKEVIINNKHNCRLVDIKNLLPITNERNIIKEENKFLVNASLLILLKMINKRIIINFINYIKKNIGKKMYLVINDDNYDSLDIVTEKILYEGEKYSLSIYSE